MNRMAAPSARALASGRLEFPSGHRLHFVLKVAALVALVAVTLAALAHFESVRPSPPTTQLERQNAALRAEVARVRAELEIERSSRSALDAQVRDLSAEAGELRSQLEFIAAQSSRARSGGR